MENLILLYVEQVQYIQEVNRIVQGLSKTTGKPAEHIDKLWKDTEKEMLMKHTFGVTDKYREIGNLVKTKLGEKPEPEKPKEPADDEAQSSKAKDK